MFKTTALDSVGNEYVDKNIGTGDPGTRLEADDRNIIQDELVNAIEATGQVLDATGVIRDQLSIAMAINSGKGFDSIAELRASTLTPFEGQIVKINGYYSGAENKPWKFKWDETSVIADDTGVHIKNGLITTGRWIRVFDGNIIFDTWFGVLLNTPTDRTTELQNAINFVESIGGGIVMLSYGTNQLSLNIIVKSDNTFLEGVGQGYNQSGGIPDSATASSILEWIGSAGGTMIDFGPLVGADYGIKGGGISKLFLDGNSIAGRGLLTRAAYSSKFTQITESECTISGYDVTTENSLIIDPGTQQSCIYDMITSIHQKVTSGDCFRLSGDTIYNPSLNYFGVLKLLHYDGDALQVGSSDGNYFAYTSVFRHPSGTGIGVLLGGASDPAAACRKNVFGFVQADDGGLFSQGGVAGPAIDNTVLYYSLGNSSPLPTIGTDSTLTYTTSTGQKFGPFNSEGAFTPEFTFDTPGDLSVIYANQSGVYSREGNFAHVSLKLVFTPTFSTASGSIKLTGLPLISDISGAESSLAINGLIGITFGVGTIVAGRIIKNSQYANIISMGSGINNFNLDTTHITSGVESTFIMSGTYRVQ